MHKKKFTDSLPYGTGELAVSFLKGPAERSKIKRPKFQPFKVVIRFTPFSKKLISQKFVQLDVHKVEAVVKEEAPLISLCLSCSASSCSAAASSPSASQVS
eukprot:GHVP01007203.1.p1 GENE.GHVP01007203.1~~GHVP01007203.1.p1  ORF type:complete len:101 (-),score=13.77 GHVP01007203.1:513-815(-)